jgi:hypothetical protein
VEQKNKQYFYNIYTRFSTFYKIIKSAYRFCSTFSPCFIAKLEKSGFAPLFLTCDLDFARHLLHVDLDFAPLFLKVDKVDKVDKVELFHLFAINRT